MLWDVSEREEDGDYGEWAAEWDDGKVCVCAGRWKGEEGGGNVKWRRCIKRQQQQQQSSSSSRSDCAESEKGDETELRIKAHMFIQVIIILCIKNAAFITPGMILTCAVPRRCT